MSSRRSGASGGLLGDPHVIGPKTSVPDFLPEPKKPPWAFQTRDGAPREKKSTSAFSARSTLPAARIIEKERLDPRWRPLVGNGDKPSCGKLR